MNFSLRELFCCCIKEETSEFNQISEDLSTEIVCLNSNFDQIPKDVLPIVLSYLPITAQKIANMYFDLETTVVLRKFLKSNKSDEVFTQADQIIVRLQQIGNLLGCQVKK